MTTITSTKSSKERLHDKYKEMHKLVKTFAGYPCNADFNYKELYPFLEIPLNNVGDALTETNYQLNTHDFEREVLRSIATLLRLPEHYWGYVTSGGSEGNLCGLHFARQLYPDAPVFYSKHSHYSIEKAVRITHAEGHCLDSLPNGEMDYDQLDQALAAQQGKAVIMLANAGTTMTGAIDNLDTINALIKKHHIKDSYIHVDAALHGFIIPFTEGPNHLDLNKFQSIAISGHKFIGSPLPCGIFLTHQWIAKKQSQYIEYVKINDCSISGSRNAFTPLILWYALQKVGEKKFKERVEVCLNNTAYAVEKLNAKGINAWANPQSPIVIFPKPSSNLIKKWQLAPYEDIAHIVVMPHVDKPFLDLIIADLVKEAQGEAINPELSSEEKHHLKEWLIGAGVVVGIAGLLATIILNE